MKKSTLCILLIIVFISAGCGKEPLKFRNILEADQYVRNNIPTMNWEEFQWLLSEKNDVSEKEFELIKEMLSEEYSSSHMIVENKIYRYDDKQNLMYMIEWNGKSTLALKDIHVVEE